MLEHLTVLHNPHQLAPEHINASVIWLHGLGASGHDFEPIVPALGLPAELAVRFIFPHAPSIPVTVNGGYVMPAWYDILEMTLERKIDETQIRASADAIAQLIAQEMSRGVPSERIVIAGFSQGGAVAYETVLSYPKKLAGLMALSTYFATKDSVHINPIQADTPIFIGHGTSDPVVPEVLGQQASAVLTEKGFAPEYHTYPVEHSVHFQEVRDIGKWLTKVLV